ncbi:MAG: FkbM family methyltransferase [Bacteriovoracia bacterium]
MLIETKKKFQGGEIDKHQMMQDLYKVHQNLFDYPRFIEDSPIKKIEILQNRVLFHVDNNGKTIKLVCDGRDAYSLPLIYMNLCETETLESQIIHQMVKPGDIVFDIGANIGWYTISLMQKIKDVTVYSFEPIKSSFGYLKENLDLNGLPSDRIFNFGLSDENKTVQFFFDVQYAMASSMANLRQSKSTISESCEIKRLDDFVSSIQNFNRLDFIKCDVEGAELLVFKGGLKTIEQFKPIVFSEMLRKWSAKFGYHPNQIIELFSNLNYECFAIGDQNLRKIAIIDEDTPETNYLFLDKNKHMDQIQSLSAF